MTRILRHLTFALLTGTCLVSTASAATLVRQPYLQMPAPNSVLVVFHTDVDIGTPEVEFGTTTALGSSATGTTSAHTTYDPADASIEIANFKHVVELTGLAADTKYYYTVGSTTATITTAGEDYAFSTLPEYGSQQPIRIWTFGDSGYWPGKDGTEFVDTRQAYFDWVTGATPGTGTPNAAADETDLMLYLGDNCYFGFREQDCNRVFWSPEGMYSFHRRQPFVSAMGNHEGYYNNSVDETGTYFESLYLPTARELGTNGVASGTESYYSFDVANTHFVVLDTEDIIETPAARSAMLTWLESDLAATDADWTIAAWHRPPYTAGLVHGSDTEGNEIDARTYLLPVLNEFNVDLTLHGHSHTYERTGLLKSHYGLSPTLERTHLVDGGDGNPDSDGPYRKTSGNDGDGGAVHVVAGSPADLRYFAGPVIGDPAGTLHPVMAKSIVSLGTLVIDIDGLKLTGRMIDDTGAIADHFEIQKGPRCPSQLTVAGCTEAGKSKLVLKKNAKTSDRDSALFRANKTTFDAAGFDPFEGASNAFCLYEDNELIMDVVAPDASFKGYDTADEYDENGVHHWQGWDRPDVTWDNKRPGLYLFKDKTRSWDGTQLLKFKGGDKGSLNFKMKGPDADVPAPPLSSASDTSIVAQVRNLDGDGCIYGVMDTPKKNEEGKFIANGTLVHGDIDEPGSVVGAFVDGNLLY